MADRVGVAVDHGQNLSPRSTRGRCAGELSDREAPNVGPDASGHLGHRSLAVEVTSIDASSSADSRSGPVRNGANSSANTSIAWRS